MVSLCLYLLQVGELLVSSSLTCITSHGRKMLYMTIYVIHTALHTLLLYVILYLIHLRHIALAF